MMTKCQNPNDTISAWCFLDNLILELVTFLTHMCAPTYNMHASEFNYSLSRIACSCVILSIWAQRQFSDASLDWKQYFFCIWFLCRKNTILHVEMFFFPNDTRKTCQLKKLRSFLSIVLKQKLIVYCMENIKGLWIIYWSKCMINSDLMHLK